MKGYIQTTSFITDEIKQLWPYMVIPSKTNNFLSITQLENCVMLSIYIDKSLKPKAISAIIKIIKVGEWENMI